MMSLTLMDHVYGIGVQQNLSVKIKHSEYTEGESLLFVRERRINPLVQGKRLNEIS